MFQFFQIILNFITAFQSTCFELFHRNSRRKIRQPTVSVLGEVRQRWDIVQQRLILIGEVEDAAEDCATLVRGAPVFTEPLQHVFNQSWFSDTRFACGKIISRPNYLTTQSEGERYAARDARYDGLNTYSNENRQRHSKFWRNFSDHICLPNLNHFLNPDLRAPPSEVLQ